MIETLKRWLGFKPKQFETESKVKEITFPDGRVARTDEKGNFLGFKKS